MKREWPWKVFEHGPIERLEENLWEVAGEVPVMPMNRRMSIVKLADGSLVVHNAICLTEEEQKQIDEWGPVRFIIVPSGFHRIDAPRYASRYPGAKVVCPAPAKAKVESRVRVDGDLSLIPSDPGLTVETIAGNRIQEAVLIVRSGERTSLVFNDMFFNLPKLPGFRGWAYGLMGSTGGPKVTPLMKVYAANDKAALREHMQRLAGLPGLIRAIPGHGDVVEGETTTSVMKRVADAV
jgi:hypothetical protein